MTEFVSMPGLTTLIATIWSKSQMRFASQTVPNPPVPSRVSSL